ncbi:AI-2E family transporter [Paracoccus luteus]|uniref:AI-2E family transporter n=1 Tax=Paracoccus luteus TaxID=2508543 RepID=UPI00106F6013|nr:AI-2E family transporter [Paracoccus luteus]
MPPRDFVTSHRFPRPSRPEGERPAFPRWPVIGIFLILGFGFIAEARSFLMPVTLAFLLFFVFVPFRRFMSRRGIGASVTAGIVVVGLVLGIAVLGYLVSGPVGTLMANSDTIGARLEDRFQTIRESFRGIEEAAAKLDEISSGGAAPEEPAPGAAPVPPGGAPGNVAVQTATDGDAQTTTVAAPGGAAATATMTTTTAPGGAAPVTTTQDIRVEVDSSDGPSTLQQALTMGPDIAGQIIFTLVLLFFMLSAGDLLYLKIVQSFETMKEKRAAYLALREIEDRLGTYLGAITMVNLGLGLAIGLAMWAWGMPSPILFGVAGFVLNYIPYIGAILGTVVSAVVALLVFDDLWSPIMVGLTFLGLTAVEGQFVTPYFVSRRLQLNEVVVFLTVALWAWLWSILGMVVAVPTLVVLRVLADHIPGLEKFGNFLAGEDPPELEDEDEDEAREIVDEGEKADTMEEAAVATHELAPESDLIPRDADRTPGSAARAGGEAG